MSLTLNSNFFRQQTRFAHDSAIDSLIKKPLKEDPIMTMEPSGESGVSTGDLEQSNVIDLSSFVGTGSETGTATVEKLEFSPEEFLSMVEPTLAQLDLASNWTPVGKTILKKLIF